MVNYSDFVDKKVTIETDSVPEPREGTVTAGSDVGIVFRPKGLVRQELIEIKNIRLIEEIIAGPKPLRPRTTGRVNKGKHREHLVDRHGYKISEISHLSEDQAREFHDGIDHSDLGHRHKEKTEIELKIEEASVDED